MDCNHTLWQSGGSFPSRSSSSSVLLRHRLPPGPGGGCRRELRSIARSLSSGWSPGNSRELSWGSTTLGLFGPGPIAWIRSGVESDCESTNSCRFFLFESVCIVYDRPCYPRVGQVLWVRGAVKRWSSCCVLFPVCGLALPCPRTLCLVPAVPD